ncbi:MAG: hypothetical protein ABSF82_02590 [Candidatus Bathyarchaeia archaeon]
MRTTILYFLVEERPSPKRSKRGPAWRDECWNATSLSNQKKLNPTSVLKVVSKFRACGLLEPEPSSAKLVEERLVPTRTETRSRRTVSTFRGAVPCRPTEKGRRLAKMMRAIEENKMMPEEFSEDEDRAAENEKIVSRLAAAGFTREDYEAAIECGLIAEESRMFSRPTVGFRQPGLSAADLVSVEVAKYRHRVT